MRTEHKELQKLVDDLNERNRKIRENGNQGINEVRKILEEAEIDFYDPQNEVLAGGGADSNESSSLPKIKTGGI